MHNKTNWLKFSAIGIISTLAFSSCVTTYDAVGRPVQTVDPGAAIVGAAVIGTVAYAAGNNNRSRSYKNNNYYRQPARAYRAPRRGRY